MAISYPGTRRGDEADLCHGERVPDPYRWLEDPDTPEAKAWIEAQNRLSDEWLSSVPTRAEIRARVAELWDYARHGVPFEKGGRWFQFRNPGLENQPVLHVAESLEGPWRVLLDPNLLAPDGTVAVTSAVPSEDGSLLAYATHAAGSDWTTWRVLEVAGGTELPDVVEWSKFSSASFTADGAGFFYGAPDRPEEGAEYEAETRHLAVRYHRLGTDPADDEVVFATPEEPEWLPHATVSDDGRYLVVSVSRGTSTESQLHVLDLAEPGGAPRTLVGDFSVEAEVVANVGSRFLLLTNDGAPRRRIVSVDLDGPGPGHWREVVAETADTLLGARQCGSQLVCWYLSDAHSKLVVRELDGRFVREVELPAFSALMEDREAPPVSGRPGLQVVCFGTTSFTESGSIWAHDLESGETRLLSGSQASFDAAAYVTERAYATSPDGTKVPLFLTRRRDLEADGEVPVLLYGYGGFDIPVVPSFQVAAAVFVERGGIYAVANLRGGGEFGREWYEAGRLGAKQNVFDDFAAAARHLVEAGWSRPERIAINGRSNGGLLVGACLTQHPELFGAAVPEVGVLDMLRFHKFTIGWAWTSDYGSPEDEAAWRVLRSYSPLHEVRDGVAYPATMVMTGDHDDRVVPGHSFKFAAALQHAQAGEAPVLCRIETSAGHGAGKPTSKLIAERSDLLTFLEGTLGLARRGAS